MTRVGHYEIREPLGKGGMGEVYRAFDPKLGRDVAIKILPETFAQDADRLARFEREAKVLASLNHPNIAAIYGVEDRALVMELVEGETLHGPLPLEVALNYARQIAEALEAAHEKGIIHRDLKPANIKIKPDGTVKVLDFGLAKATEEPAASGDPTNSPTLTISPTRAGMIMGTAAYMAPEQAKGRPADRRADIWAFGVVLYEMLTGKQLFTGDSAGEILASVIKEEPKLHALPASVLPIVERCLRKDVKKRWQAIGDVRIAMEEAGTEVPWQAVGPPHSKLLWPGVAAAFMLVAVALAFIHFREPPPPAPQVLRATIDAPLKTRITNFAVSPDGRYVAMITTGEPGQMWVRPLDSLQPQALAGTEGATYPFWSPDSRYIGFFAGGKLKKISIIGGLAQTLCDAPNAGGGTWNSENIIVFAMLNVGLSRVSGAGGVPSKLPETNALSLYPTFLPDGRRFLYEGTAGKEPGVYVGSLDEKPDLKTRQRIVANISNAQYLSPSDGSPQGYILFVREQTLMAQPVDPNSLQPAGDVFPLVEQVSPLPNTNFYRYSISHNGIILHLTGFGALRQHAIFDRGGKEVALIGGHVSTPGHVALSPDEKRMISERGGPGRVDLWITELHGPESRFTFDASTNAAPVWSPDGNYVVFASNRGGAVQNLYRKAANQGVQDELIFKSEFASFPTDWSHDGRFIIFRQFSPKSNFDLFALPVSGDKKPIPLLKSEFNEVEGAVSPDGRWLAYASDESGTFQVYVQAFAPGSSKPSSGKWQVSISGGRDPHWRGDGREIFYLAPDRKMMAMAVKTEGDTFVRSTQQALFEVRFPVEGTTLSRYAVSADGKRFLMAAEPEGSPEAEPLHVTVNWLAAVKK